MKATIKAAIISVIWKGVQKFKTVHYINVVYSPNLGIDITEDQRIELSHRQERHYGVRALREEFDFSQDWLTAREQNGNPPTLTREQRCKRL